MDEKIQGVPWLWFFPGVSISRYIYFPGGKSVQLVIFFRCGGLKIFFMNQFFPRDHKSTKIQFQGINKSTNRFCKDVYFFLIIHTDTPDKKCIAHFLLWWRQITKGLSTNNFCHARGILSVKQKKPTASCSNISKLIEYQPKSNVKYMPLLYCQIFIRHS